MSFKCRKLIDTWKHNFESRKWSKCFNWQACSKAIASFYFAGHETDALHSELRKLSFKSIWNIRLHWNETRPSSERVSVSFVLMVVIWFISCVFYSLYAIVYAVVSSVRWCGCKIFCLFDAHLSIKLEISAKFFFSIAISLSIPLCFARSVVYAIAHLLKLDAR